MVKYALVSQNNESTVVSEYIADYKKSTNYQTEQQLEHELINQLKSQAYQYLDIHIEQDLIKNLKIQLEKLNNIKFSDNEWKQFFKTHIANKTANIEDKTRTIQEDYIKILNRDDGTFKNIYLIDKLDIHNNTLQVINQYSTDEGKRKNRYDVTILVNGLPLVHVELKRRGVNIKEAFNQIKRYQNESFWAGSGLFEYIQVFVISNGTFTKYYSNTTRLSSIKENNSSSVKKGKRTSNSFEFTSWWADSNNTPIADLMDFAKTFFAKHTILNILTRYCVFTSESLLLVMRPYQIVATERILSKIKIADNYKQYGSVDGGGYVWHTTGSGKTLTSFKVAQLATKLPYIDKVLFVVDRKDLDYQTMKEYDKFQKGAANSNKSTAILQKQLEDKDSKNKIIITTIQKLTVSVKKNKQHDIYNKRVVIIFDECHRSQFGSMHKLIIKTFKKYNIFGFTGTPIFAQNAGGKYNLQTTEQTFGQNLHTYTIVDAIRDKNVLPFRVDYIKTMKQDFDNPDKQVSDIDRKKALTAPERISKIVSYILEHFNQKTIRNTYYKLKDRRLLGFNSIFAADSIQESILYYKEFEKQMSVLPKDKRLKIALIYSFCQNEDEEENSESTDGLDENSRDFLDKAISNYNEMFQTNFDTTSEKFQNYYKDVSLKTKNREIDLLLVVNMFLTGFDATTLNTLWVDKNLRLHGLLQAYSRTNRILNSVKTFGNIVCFRNLEKATNESISLFGNKDAKGIVLLKTYKEYYYGYKEDKENILGYVDYIKQLQEKFPVNCPVIESEKAKKDFIKLYNVILRLKNILSAFDEFVGNEILSQRDFQDYHSIYIDLYNEFRNKNKQEKENINDDIIFEIELIKQVEINIDYILMLIKKYYNENMKDKEIIVKIQKSIDATIELRSKKDLIMKFIETLTPNSDVDKDWMNFIKDKRIEELNIIIEEENLNKEETYKFVNNAFYNGYVQEYGTEISKILPSISIFSPSKDRTIKRLAVVEKLKAFFDKYKDICSEDIELDR